MEFHWTTETLTKVGLRIAFICMYPVCSWQRRLQAGLNQTSESKRLLFYGHHQPGLSCLRSIQVRSF